MKITSLIIFLGFVTVVESFVSTPFLTAHSTVAKEGTSLSPTSRTAKKDDKTVVETVRKPEFISKIAEKSGLTKADSEAALAAILETISEEVAAGKKISMVGFGTFKLTERAARLGRNPKTGEEIQIKASKSPKFTAGKAFKEQCNS